MTIEQREIWFPAKKYGWGWGLPVAWQGWLVYASYILLAIVGATALRKQYLAAHVVYMVLLTAGLLAVCWLKGERPLRRGRGE